MKNMAVASWPSKNMDEDQGNDHLFLLRLVPYDTEPGSDAEYSRLLATRLAT